MDRQCHPCVICRNTWTGRNDDCHLTNQQGCEELESLTEVCPSIAQSTDCFRPRDFNPSLTREFRMSATCTRVSSLVASPARHCCSGVRCPPKPSAAGSRLAMLRGWATTLQDGSERKGSSSLRDVINRLPNSQPAPTAAKISRANSLDAICWNSASSR